MNKYKRAINTLMTSDIRLYIYKNQDEVIEEHQPTIFDFYHNELFCLKELVEKTTPKKVTIDTKRNAHCPICGEIQVFGYYDVNNKYCLKCGQALDWSEQ